MRRLGFVLLLLLSACAVGPPPDPVGPFAAYIGRTDQALIERFGVPDRTYTIGAKTFFTYDRLRLRIVPGSPAWGGGAWGYPYDGYAYGWRAAPYAYQTGCIATLEIQNHIVRAVNVASGICE